MNLKSIDEADRICRFANARGISLYEACANSGDKIALTRKECIKLAESTQYSLTSIIFSFINYPSLKKELNG